MAGRRKHLAVCEFSRNLEFAVAAELQPHQLDQPHSLVAHHWMTDKPTLKCWIVGGTNGSGKSSIYQNSSELLGSGEFVNADLVARRISPHDTDTARLDEELVPDRLPCGQVELESWRGLT
jgi:hypothetical protein